MFWFGLCTGKKWIEVERFFLEMAEKQYGLILKGKNAAKKKVASVFNEDSSEDEETKAVVSGGIDWMKKKLTSSVNAKSGATGLGTKVKAQTKIEIQRAIEEDPTVYQYDEVYDQMEAAKVEKVTKKKDVDRKPKYISNLLKQAEIRTKENERRIERKVQKEREAEGDEFADKEKFVTSAYRKKMEEMQKLEEEDRKREALENILDVTKQKDMSGFYRHLYRQNFGEEKDQKEEEIKTEIKEENDVVITKKTKPSQRSYRQRGDSGNMEADNPSDKDSASSSSDSSDDEAEEKLSKETEERNKEEKEKARREELKRQKDKRERRKRRIEEGRDTSSDESDSSADDESGEKDKRTESKDANKENRVESAPPPPKKEKKDIWKKVTVGEKFDEAFQRFLQRKSERGTRFPW